MPGLENLRSTSVAGLNDIKCQFAYGTDYWSARQEVINRIGFVANLPPGVQPGLSPWSPTGEIVRYVLEGPGYTTNQLKAVQDWVLQRTLKTVPGVIDVTGYGGTVKQYQVLVDTRLLRQYNVTLKQVEDAIDNSNANVGGDILTLGSQAHNVRALGLIGGGKDPLRPDLVEQSDKIISAEARRHQQRRRRLDQRHPDLRQAGRPGRRAAPAEAGDRRPAAQGEGRPARLDRRGRRHRGNRPDAEVREVAGHGRTSSRRSSRTSRLRESCPRG